MTFDEDIIAPMFFHLNGKHKVSVNRALHALSRKGLIYEYGRAAQENGGNPTIVYRRALVLEGFQRLDVNGGWLADLYIGCLSPNLMHNVEWG